MKMLIFSFIVSLTLFILSLTKVIDLNIVTIGLFVSIILTTTAMLIYLIETSSLKREKNYERKMLDCEKEMTSVLKLQIKAYQDFIKTESEKDVFQKKYIEKLKELIQVKENIILELKKD